MRIKDEIFCFAHLRWCHNGWASNILIVVDTGYAGIHHSKYWMPIHYDTIEDGQKQKISSFILSKSPCRNEGGTDTQFCGRPLVPLVDERTVTTSSLPCHRIVTTWGHCGVLTNILCWSMESIGELIEVNATIIVPVSTLQQIVNLFTATKRTLTVHYFIAHILKIKSYLPSFIIHYENI